MVLTFEEFQRFEPSRPTYALFGWPLGHTMSPELHAALFATDRYDAAYIGVAVPPEQLAQAFALAAQKLRGLNLTIPHKKEIIPFLDEIDSGARDLNSVNTVAFTDGKSKGYNTDTYGFSASLERDRVTLAEKKVLLLGYGGAAAVMGYHCARAGAQVLVTGRNLSKAQALAHELQAALPDAVVDATPKRHLPSDIQIVINGTPLGMFPHEDECPLRFLPRHTEYVFDAIYNPPMTSTIRLAHGRRIQTRDGLSMLVLQAAGAQTIWTGRSFSTQACDSILKQLYAQMAVKRLHDKYGKDNLVLCGFMGSGKTTAGRKIARLTGLQFVDADQYLEACEQRTIPEIFAQDGEAVFRDLESKYIAQLARRDGMVIALGGGAVLRAENVAALKQSGLLIHLDTPFYRIVKNLSYSSNRPLLEKGDKMAQTRKLYNARKSTYLHVADLSVRTSRLSELIDRIIRSI